MVHGIGYRVQGMIAFQTAGFTPCSKALKLTFPMADFTTGSAAVLETATAALTPKLPAAEPKRGRGGGRGGGSSPRGVQPGNIAVGKGRPTGLQQLCRNIFKTAYHTIENV